MFFHNKFWFHPGARCNPNWPLCKTILPPDDYHRNLRSIVFNSSPVKRPPKGPRVMGSIDPQSNKMTIIWCKDLLDWLPWQQSTLTLLTAVRLLNQKYIHVNNPQRIAKNKLKNVITLPRTLQACRFSERYFGKNSRGLPSLWLFRVLLWRRNPKLGWENTCGN